MNVRYRVTLSASERAQLVTMMLGGKGAARRLKRAQILLAADGGSRDDEIARTVAVGTSTVDRTKQRFVEEGLERALSELSRPGAARKLGVVDESLLVAVACSKPPEGRAHWTLQLLADEMVRLTVHDSVSDETIRRRLDNLQLKPWLRRMRHRRRAASRAWRPACHGSRAPGRWRKIADRARVTRAVAYGQRLGCRARHGDTRSMRRAAADPGEPYPPTAWFGQDSQVCTTTTSRSLRPAASRSTNTSGPARPPTTLTGASFAPEIGTGTGVHGARPTLRAT